MYMRVILETTISTSYRLSEFFLSYCSGGWNKNRYAKVDGGNQPRLINLYVLVPYFVLIMILKL